MAKNKTCLGAQLYTLREFLKTPQDIAKSLQKVSAMGWRAVQCSGLGPIDPKELAKILSDNGLACAATHVSFERMRDETQAVIDEHRIWGCEYTAIGGMPGEYRNKDGYARFAKDASPVAQKLKAAGLVFGYHNHSFELEKFGGPKTGLDIIFEQSSPEVTMEVDTYWVQHGGGDPAATLRKYAGRVPLVHFKDMGVHNGQPVMFEVGEGNLNWPEILKACKKAKVVWYLIEQDTCLRDPFESLKISLDHCHEWGLK